MGVDFVEEDADVGVVVEDVVDLGEGWAAVRG